MKKSQLLFCTFLLACNTLLAAGKPAGANPFLFASNKPAIKVHNRILIHVKGKTITVRDVQKKMDVIFQREFPEYANIPEARLQFYTAQWRFVLKDMVDRALIMADAERMEIKISSGDIKQEMHELFGRDLNKALEQLGLSYDEATEMVKTDLLIRRIMGMKVHMAAQMKLRPQEVRSGYEEYVKTFSGEPQWVYRIITIRHPDLEEGKVMATYSHDAIKNGYMTPREVVDQLAKEGEGIQGRSVTLSEQFSQKAEELSPQYKEVLAGLQKGAVSDPIVQDSRATNSKVYRLFVLEDKITQEPLPFAEMETAIKEKLTQKVMGAETDRYMEKLHRYYGITDATIEQQLPPNFQPFTLN